MTLIYGFDLSSRKIAMVALEKRKETAKFVVETITVPKRQSRSEELYHLEQLLRYVLQAYVPGWFYIEAPVVGRGGARPTILQAQVDSLIQVASIRFAHLGCYSVNNKTWKKAVVGNGNAKKEDTAAWLAVAYPALSQLCGDDQDLLDAAGVALYGLGVIAKSEERYPDTIRLDP